MNIQEAEEVLEIFYKKAPKEFFLDFPKIKHKNVMHGGSRLFNGPHGEAQTVANLLIKAIDSDNVSLSLEIGPNVYTFLNNQDLCIELIQRCVPSFIPKLKI